jgi:transglutaminase-like putative cysteine protease
MSIHVALHHRTSYEYDKPIEHGPHVVRLRPAAHSKTRVLAYSLKIGPGDHFINWQQDPQGNYLARLVFNEPMPRLDVEVNLVVEMAVHNPFDFFLEESAQNYPFEYEKELKHELAPYLEVEGVGPRVCHCTRWFSKRKGRTIDVLVELNSAAQKAVEYKIRLEPGVQTPEETLEKGSGSCRDSAWLLVNVLRGMGLAARFVSGYLIQLKPDVESLDGPSGSEVDFTDLHAWTEVYLPGAGWIGLDPTSGLLAGEGHLPLACSPRPGSAAPVSGGTEPCESRMEHEMYVTRIHESPRTTLPYTEDAWEKILSSGRDIDTELQSMDVRLTMGGEPTFISMDDLDGDEWNNAAQGPTKRKLSDKLIKRLREKFAPGGLLFYGQGKWYPGEELPRWSLACYWRKDGEPIWGDVSLIADESTDYGFGPPEAERFAKALAEGFGIDPKFLIPGYEDAFYYMWRERRLPSNVDPLKSNLKSKLERDRIARIFETGLNSVAGHVLPLKKKDSRWTSGSWFLRDETLFLLPGDSPMGYRLPLDSLPWVKKEDYPWAIPQDPTAIYAPLPTRSAVMQIRHGEPSSSSDEVKEPAAGESAGWITRAALCVEPREGRIYVFLPPVDTTEDFLEMVAVIEKTAAELEMPIILEGTSPSFDPRLEVVKVTPDPGVIEVNLQPAASWDALVSNTTTLYEEARLCRLVTEKFMIDGRHTGTGGGNHIIIGGETPSDSPILRRPDLLRSMVTFWNHHPSLSYLFSGLFVGPTAHRRGAQRRDPRAGSRFPHAGGRGKFPAMESGSRLPQPADRLHGQHPSRRVLHRQALFPRQRHGSPRAIGNARLRDAAALPYEPRAAPCPPRPRRPFLERSLRETPRPLGQRDPRSLDAAPFRLAGFPGRPLRSQRLRIRHRKRMVPPAPRVPFPAHRRSGACRHRDGTAPRHRAMACPRWSGWRSRSKE